MNPVLAENEIQLLEQFRQRYVADAERDRLVRARATPTDVPSSRGASLSRAWKRPYGAIKDHIRFGGVRPVEFGGEGVAAQP